MKKQLIWLEDKPEELADLLPQVRGIIDEVEVRSKPLGIKRLLDKNKNKPSVHICGIVIDIMLTNVQNLDDIGIDNIKTPGGFDAGLAFMKHYLLKNPEWQTLPMCIFTVIEDDRVKELIKQHQTLQTMFEDGKSRIIEKFVGDWEGKFLRWVESITKAGDGKIEK